MTAPFFRQIQTKQHPGSAESGQHVSQGFHRLLQLTLDMLAADEKAQPGHAFFNSRIENGLHIMSIALLFVQKVLKYYLHLTF